MSWSLRDPGATKSWLKSNASDLQDELVSWQKEYGKVAFYVSDNDITYGKSSDAGRKLIIGDIAKVGATPYADDSRHLKTVGWKSDINIDPNGIGTIIAINKTLTQGLNYSQKGEVPKFIIKREIRYGSGKCDTVPISFIKSDSRELDKISAVSNGVQIASSQLPVAASLLVGEGDAGIGIPLAFTSTEKRLTVVPTLSRSYDIYWLQFAVNPSEELVDNINELRYDVELETKNSIVLDIVPIRVGIEENVTNKGAIPEVRIGDVEVGEMFSRTVEYKFIRPTIIGHGVQTSSFGWIFSDEAVDASTKRMFAVAGVPKGTREAQHKNASYG